MHPAKVRNDFSKLTALVPASVDDFSWASVCEFFPFLADLDACRQDPIHHGEGNVGIHTRMVITELLADPAYQTLDEHGRFKMFWTAVFHDTGKPATFEEVDGRITARGHSRVGALIAREHLRSAIVPFALREEICAIISFHQQPFWLFEHEEKEQRRRAIKASLVLDPKLLLMHARADARGRRCADPQDVIDRVELSAAVYDELGLLDAPYPFANDESRVSYFDHDDRDPGYAAHPDFRCNVTMTCGLQGSGKTTWLAKNRAALPKVGLDGMRDELGVDPTDNQGTVVQAALARAKEYLGQKVDFAWDSTNVTADMRGKFLRLFRDYNAHIEIVYLEPVPSDLVKQNNDRSASVSTSIIDRLARKLDPPAPWEAHRIVHVLPSALQLQPLEALLPKGP